MKEFIIIRDRKGYKPANSRFNHLDLTMNITITRINRDAIAPTSTPQNRFEPAGAAKRKKRETKETLSESDREARFWIPAAVENSNSPPSLFSNRSLA
jgi:hypothetical protein